MKNAYNIASRIDPSAPPVLRTKQPPQQLDEGSARVINTLIREVKSCRTAWKQAWPDDTALADAKRSWTKAFMSAGITHLEQIRYGIEQLRLMPGDFAPSPGTFIDWCQPTPEMAELPSVDRAYREAVRLAHPNARQNWSHPEVYHAACETGLHELRTLPEESSRKLFERAYAMTIRMSVTCAPLRTIPKGIPAPEAVTATEEERLRAKERSSAIGNTALAELRAKLKKCA